MSSIMLATSGWVWRQPLSSVLQTPALLQALHMSCHGYGGRTGCCTVVTPGAVLWSFRVLPVYSCDFAAATCCSRTDSAVNQMFNVVSTRPSPLSTLHKTKHGSPDTQSVKYCSSLRGVESSLRVTPGAKLSSSARENDGFKHLELDLPPPVNSRVHKSVFIKSSASVKECPPANFPEFAVIGRSNVGKSSLINCLTGNDKLAKVSKEPGGLHALSASCACSGGPVASRYPALLTT